MKKNNKIMGFVAVLLAAVMIAGAILSAQAAGTLSSSDIDKIVNTETDASLVANPFTAAVAAVRDSVVLVNNYQTTTYNNNSYGFFYGYGYGNPYGNGRGGTTSREQLAGTGSGTVISEYGHILTNYHVVEDASRVTVSDGENEYDATVVVSDESKDVAVLLCPELKATPATLGDSDKLQAGEWAIVIGNPLGEDFFRSTTVGVVSALEREVETDSTDKYGRKTTTTNSMIQVDAAINSGNSGGGMFNVNGELMGIPTLKYTGSYYSGSTVEGIGMCIPINSAKPLINKVLSGEITFTAPEALDNSDDNKADSNTDSTLVGKPRMGITMSNLANSRALQNGQIPKGVYVVNVEENSPAEKAGMQVGDIIVDVNDNVITSTTELAAQVADCKAGDVLKIKVYRVPGITDLTGSDDIPDGEYIDLEVTLEVIDNVKQ